MLLKLGALAILSSTLVVPALACTSDNCFRAVKSFNGNSPSFCSSYLASSSVSTPSSVATCGLAKVSSACSCLATSTTTAGTTLTTSRIVTTTSSSTITTTSSSIKTTTTSSSGPAPTVSVVNGGFEASSSSIAPWIHSGGGYVNVGSKADSNEGFDVYPHSGTYFAFFGNGGFGDDPDYLSQTLSGLIPGASYTASLYWADFDVNDDSCTLSILFAPSSTATPVVVATTIVYASTQDAGYFQLSGKYTVPAGVTSGTLEVEWTCTDNPGLIGVDDITFKK